MVAWLPAIIDLLAPLATSPSIQAAQRASRLLKRKPRLSQQSAYSAAHFANLRCVKAGLERVLVSNGRAGSARASVHAAARATRNGGGAAFAPRPRPGTASSALQHGADVS